MNFTASLFCFICSQNFCSVFCLITNKFHLFQYIVHWTVDCECVFLGEIKECSPGWCHQLWIYSLFIYQHFFLNKFRIFTEIKYHLSKWKAHMVRVDLLNRSGYHLQHINFNYFMDRWIQYEDMCWMWIIAFKRKSLSIVHFRHFLWQNKKKTTICGACTIHRCTEYIFIIRCALNKYFVRSISKMPCRKKPMLTDKQTRKKLVCCCRKSAYLLAAKIFNCVELIWI